MKRRGVLIVLTAVILASSITRADTGQLNKDEPLELGEYIKFFMRATGGGGNPRWDVGASNGELPVTWGLISETPGADEVTREGVARVKVNGKIATIQERGSRREIRWNIELQGVRAHPRSLRMSMVDECFTKGGPGCAFDVKLALEVTAVRYRILCTKATPGDRATVFELQVKGAAPNGYLIDRRSEGSGGVTNFIALHWLPPGSVSAENCGPWLDKQQVSVEIASKRA